MRARDHEWKKEKGSDARDWFEKAFRELIECSGPSAILGSRTDGVRKIVPKESSSLLGCAAGKLRREGDSLRMIQSASAIASPPRFVISTKSILRRRV